MRQDKKTPEQMAEQVAKYLLEGNKKEAVEFCHKTEKFKLKLTLGSLPPDVSRALKGCTKETVASFAGVKTRIRVVSASLLSGEVLSDLKSLGLSNKYSDCVLRMLDAKQVRREKLGQEFYKKIRR